ncbi:AAA family ATPase [bacterium]|nr:AAA family ATPase [bacterium]
MKKPTIVAGLENSGKTTFICSLLAEAKNRGRNGAAFKPFEYGLMRRNAADILGDGELFCQNMQGEPMETLVSPYCAHEDYPLEMSFRRDGININEGVIAKRLAILDDLYDFTLVEVPGSLFMPISENKYVIDWIQEMGGQVIWLIHPVKERFCHNLSELNHLKSLNINYSAIFNNASQITNQDLLFYIWEKTEKFLNRQVEGMIPFVKITDNGFGALGKKVEEAVPKVFSSLVGVE